MKVLVIDGYKYCELPIEVKDLETAIQFFNEKYHTFVKMKVWEEDKCVAPYFIAEQQKEEAINISMVNSFELEDITVYPECEYVARLAQCVKEKCANCKHNDGEEDVDSCRDKLSLDGKCAFFTQKEADILGEK